MEKLKLLQEIRINILERIINEFGTGGELNKSMLNILDVKSIFYDEINKIGERVFKEEFLR